MVLIAYCLHYLVASFQNPVPWISHGYDLNTTCIEGDRSPNMSPSEFALVKNVSFFSHLIDGLVVPRRIMFSKRSIFLVRYFVDG